MADNVKVCDIEPSLKELLKKFRFRKATTNAAIVMKVDQEKHLIVLDEEYEDYSLDDLQDELPSSQPRFLAYSYKYDHDDGRISYPLCFIYVSPQGCKPEQQMMYAGSKLALVAETQLSKSFEIRSLEELTEDWLKEKLTFFR